MASTDPEHRQEEESAKAAVGKDEDTKAQVAPIVKLEEVAVSTGEEEEDVLLDLKAKLYRFNKEGNQWKERGVGSVKLLKHKESGKVKLVMRQAKTLKICANHLVVPSITIQEHPGNEKSYVWHASDFAEGALREEMFYLRFGSVDNCRQFMEMFEEIAQSQGKKEESEDSAASIELIEKLSVGEGSTKHDKPSEEESQDSATAVELIEKLSVGEGSTKHDKPSEEALVAVDEEKKESASEQGKHDAEKKEESSPTAT
ncbi:Ran-binding protein 1 c [Asimina triloba]